MKRFSRVLETVYDPVEVAEAIIRALADLSMSDSSEVTITMKRGFHPTGILGSGTVVRISSETTKTYFVPQIAGSHALDKWGGANVFYILARLIRISRSPEQHEDFHRVLDNLGSLLRKHTRSRDD